MGLSHPAYILRPVSVFDFEWCGISDADLQQKRTSAEVNLLLGQCYRDPAKPELGLFYVNKAINLDPLLASAYLERT